MKKIFLLQYALVLSIIVSAQENKLTFNSSKPASPGEYKAKELISINAGGLKGNNGLCWDASKGETGSLEADWEQITPLSTQRVGRDGYDGYESGYLGNTWSYSLEDNLTPGALKGAFSVSDNGAAMYTVPLPLAPSAGDGVPQLAVAYNSYGSYGVFGLNTTLVGLSAISRTNKTVYRNGKNGGIEFKHRGQLFLDGQALTWLDGVIYLVPEVSAGGSFICRYLGKYIEVNFSDGSTAYYGSSDYADNCNLQYGNETVVYYLRKKVSANGFVTEYKYENNNNNILLTDIYYGKNEGDRSFPSISKHTCHVKLYYSTIDEDLTNYVYGQKRANNQVISQIYTYANDELYRSYWFDYTKSDGKTVLSRISCKGTDGSMINHTQLNWSGGSANPALVKKDYNSFIPESSYKYFAKYNIDYVTWKGEGVDNKFLGWTVSRLRTKIKYAKAEIDHYKGVITCNSGVIPCKLNDDAYTDMYQISRSSDNQYTVVTPYKGSAVGMSRINNNQFRIKTDQSRLYIGDYNGDGYTDIIGMQRDAFSPSGTVSGSTDVIQTYSAYRIFTNGNGGFNNAGASNALGLDNSRVVALDASFDKTEVLHNGVFFQPRSEYGLSGDFDGDGEDEIIVPCEVAAFALNKTVFNYIHTAVGEHIYMYFDNGSFRPLNSPTIENTNRESYPDTYKFELSVESPGSYIPFANLQAMDIDNDGMTELVNLGAGYADRLITKEDEQTFETRFDLADDGGYPFEYIDNDGKGQVLDLNNDGLLDQVFYNAETGVLRTITATDINTYSTKETSFVEYKNKEITHNYSYTSYSQISTDYVLFKTYKIPITVYDRRYEYFCIDIDGDGIVENVFYETRGSINVMKTFTPKSYDDLTEIKYTYASNGSTTHYLHVVQEDGSVEDYSIPSIGTFGDFDGDGAIDILTSDGLYSYNRTLRDNRVMIINEGDGTRLTISGVNTLSEIQRDSYINYSAYDDIKLNDLPFPAVTEYSIYKPGIGSEKTHITYNDPLVQKDGGFIGTATLRKATKRVDNMLAVSVARKSIFKFDINPGRDNQEAANVRYAMLPSVQKSYINDGELPEATAESAFSLTGWRSTLTSEYEILDYSSDYRTAAIRPVKTTAKHIEQNNDKVVNYGYASVSPSTIWNFDLFKGLTPNWIKEEFGAKSQTIATSYIACGKPDKITVTDKFSGKTSVETTAFTYDGTYYRSPASITRTRGGIMRSELYTYAGSTMTKTQQNVAGAGDLITEYEYDPTGRFVLSEKSTCSNGTIFESTFEYDNCTGDLLRETSPNGHTSSYSYDAFGNLTEAKYPDGEVVQYTHSFSDSSRYEIKETSNYGSPITTFTDLAGRTLLQQSYGYNNVYLRSTSDYDDENHSVIHTPPIIANRVVETYDEYGKLISSNIGGIENTYIHNGTDYKISTTLNDQSVYVHYKHTNEGVLDEVDNSEWGSISFSDFDAFGTAQKTDVFGTSVGTEFENGLQTKLSDPSTGIIQTEYTSDGTDNKTTYADQTAFSTEYDNMKRPVSIDFGSGSLTNTYDTEYKGKLTSSQLSYNGETSATAYTYDNMGRTLSVTETIDGEAFVTSFTYDEEGKVLTKTFPNGLTIVNEYSGTSLVSIYRGSIDPANAIWRLDATDSYGRITSSLYGRYNYHKVKKVYAGQHGEISHIGSYIGDRLIRGYEYTYNDNGNLTSQLISTDFLGFTRANKDIEIADVYEEYTYDAKDQLASVNGVPFQYDDKGNLLQMPGYTTMNYSGNGLSPYAVSSAELDIFAYPTSLEQDITYTPWRKIETVQDHLRSSTYGEYRFSYGPDFQRRKMKAYDFNSHLRFTRYYAGAYEEMRLNNGPQRQFCYISSPDGLTAIYVVDPNEPDEGTFYYVHTDRLGNIHMLTDEEGDVVNFCDTEHWLHIGEFIYGGGYRGDDGLQVFNTSPWGIRTWAQSGELVTGGCLTDRGFTGHEHLWNVSLINMNGRVYEPFLGRFLSPDPYIQDPMNPLNYNRYAYCLNNPLKYVDPSGEIIFTVIGALLAPVTGGASLAIGIAMDVTAAVNVASNWKDITSGNGDVNLGKFAAYYGIGSLNGAAMATGQAWAIGLTGSATSLLNSSVRENGFKNLKTEHLINAAVDGVISYGGAKLTLPNSGESLLGFKYSSSNLNLSSQVSKKLFGTGAKTALGTYIGDQIVKYPYTFVTGSLKYGALSNDPNKKNNMWKAGFNQANMGALYDFGGMAYQSSINMQYSLYQSEKNYQMSLDRSIQRARSNTTSSNNYNSPVQNYFYMPSISPYFYMNLND